MRELHRMPYPTIYLTIIHERHSMMSLLLQLLQPDLRMRPLIL
jgi:hypothetical protein